MKHNMKLFEGPVERIKKNTKIIELRLFDDKRKKIKIGDLIIFSKLPDQREKITVEVTGLLIYKTFSELIMDFPASYLGYTEKDKEYLKNSMYEIYSAEDEKKYGALGIKIKRISI